MVKVMKGFLAIAVAASSLYAAEGGILLGGGYLLTSQQLSGDYKIEDPFAKKLTSGFKIDWQYWYDFTPNMGVIAGLSLESRGLTVEATVGDLIITGKNHQHYFQIPILFSYTILPEIVNNVLSDFAISAGPEIGLNVYMDQDISPSDAEFLDYAAYADARITIFNTLVIGAGYSFGLATINKEIPGISGKISNSAIKLFIDYKYIAGK